MKILKRDNKKTGLKAVMETIKTGFHDNELSPTLGSIAMTLENMSMSDEQTLENSTQSLDSVITDAMEKMNLPEAETNCDVGRYDMIAETAAIATMMATNPTHSFEQNVTPSSSKDNGHRVIGSLESGENGIRKMALEAYNETDASNLIEYTTTYNLYAANPSEFVSANFPVVLMDPSDSGLRLVANLLFVQKDTHRSVSGIPTDFKRRSLTSAARDHTILSPDVTRIIPVVRPESVDMFADAVDLPPRSIVYNDIAINTAPLAVGKRLDLIAISQNDDLFARGAMGLEDQLDVDIQLTNVYIKVGADVINLPTKGITTSRFVASRQESVTGMNLNFSSRHILLNEDTTAADGVTPLVDLAGIGTGNLKVRLRLDMNGNADIDTGTTVVFAGNVEVDSVYDSADNQLDLTVAPALDIVTAVEAAQIIGYELYATRSNTDMRQRGHIIGNSTYVEEYFVGLGSPITSLRPVNTNKDNVDLDSLIAGAHIRMSNNAILAMKETAATLDGIQSSGITGDFPDTLGLGRLFVNPRYIREELDVALHITTQNSNDAARNAGGLMVNLIKDIAARLILETNIEAGARVLNPTSSEIRPTIVVSTNAYYAHYLSTSIDARLTDNEYDFKVVTDSSSELDETIYITLQFYDEKRNSEPNILSFGCTAYAPEVVFNVNASRDGQHSRELAVYPRFKQIVTCPIMGQIDVRNLTDSLGRPHIYLEPTPPNSITAGWA